MVGINYKDQPENARRFLGDLGNPFAAVGADRAGRSAIEWGVYGVPETFLVDQTGKIVYKHVGPFTLESVKTICCLLWKRLFNNDRAFSSKSVKRLRGEISPLD